MQPTRSVVQVPRLVWVQEASEVEDLSEYPGAIVEARHWMEFLEVVVEVQERPDFLVAVVEVPDRLAILGAVEVWVVFEILASVVDAARGLLEILAVVGVLEFLEIPFHDFFEMAVHAFLEIDVHDFLEIAVHDFFHDFLEIVVQDFFEILGAVVHAARNHFEILVAGIDFARNLVAFLGAVEDLVGLLDCSAAVDVHNRSEAWLLLVVHCCTTAWVLLVVHCCTTA